MFLLRIVSCACAVSHLTKFLQNSQWHGHDHQLHTISFHPSELSIFHMAVVGCGMIHRLLRLNNVYLVVFCHRLSTLVWSLSLIQLILYSNKTGNLNDNNSNGKSAGLSHQPTFDYTLNATYSTCFVPPLGITQHVVSYFNSQLLVQNWLQLCFLFA